MPPRPLNAPKRKEETKTITKMPDSDQSADPAKSLPPTDPSTRERNNPWRKPHRKHSNSSHLGETSKSSKDSSTVSATSTSTQTTAKNDRSSCSTVKKGSKKKSSVPRKCLVIRRTRPSPELIKTELRLVTYETPAASSQREAVEFPVLMNATAMLADRLRDMQSAKARKEYDDEQETRRKLAPIATKKTSKEPGTQDSPMSLTRSSLSNETTQMPKQSDSSMAESTTTTVTTTGCATEAECKGGKDCYRAKCARSNSNEDEIRRAIEILQKMSYKFNGSLRMRNQAPLMKDQIDRLLATLQTKLRERKRLGESEREAVKKILEILNVIRSSTEMSLPTTVTVTETLTDTSTVEVCCKRR